MSLEKPAGFEYDPERHLYSYQGRPVPSVTEILKADPSFSLAGVPAELLERGAVWGHAVHFATEYWDRGIYEEGKDAALDRCVESWRRAKLDLWRGFEPDGQYIEEQLFNLQRFYAGTADRIWDFRSTLGCIYLVDIKSGSSLNLEYCALQLAGYAVALEALLGRWNYKAVVVHLREGYKIRTVEWERYRGKFDRELLEYMKAA